MGGEDIHQVIHASWSSFSGIDVYFSNIGIVVIRDIDDRTYPTRIGKKYVMSLSCVTCLRLSIDSRCGNKTMKVMEFL